MSNNPNITVTDFEKICRTCLSKEDLVYMYEKCSKSTGFAQMLMSCTVLKFAEDDGLPTKICKNCIDEMKQAFSFAQRCLTTDTILRKCVKTFKIELLDTVELMIKSEEIEIKPDTFFANTYRLVQDVLGDYAYVEELKTPEKVNIELEEYVDEIEEDNDAKIDIEYHELDGDPTHENYGENQDETGSNNEDSESYDDPADKTYEEDDNQNETSFETWDNSGSQSTNSQTEEKSKGNNGTNSKIEEEILTGYPKPQDCSVCTKSFSHKSHLILHMRIHTGEKPYVCSICDRAFSQSSALKTHIMRLHRSDKPRKSVKKHSNSLKDNMKKRKTFQSYTCSDCGKNFSRQGLIDHIRTHTGEKPFKCSVCSKCFAVKSHLTVHMRIHTGEKPHSCENCNMKFRTNGDLRRHKQTHTGEKPHICSTCSNTFTNKQSLTMHMRRHNNEKPFSCDVCDKAFIRSGALTKHKRVHIPKEKKPTKLKFEYVTTIGKIGAKRFSCEDCDRKFTRKWDMTRHKKTHTATYSCKDCGRNFSTYKACTWHEKAYLGKQLHKCSVCNKVFHQDRFLRRHMRKQTCTKVIQTKELEGE